MVVNPLGHFVGCTQLRSEDLIRYTTGIIDHVVLTVFVQAVATVYEPAFVCRVNFGAILVCNVLYLPFLVGPVSLAVP